jgi:hypothetical protein
VALGDGAERTDFSIVRHTHTHTRKYSAVSPVSLARAAQLLRIVLSIRLTALAGWLLYLPDFAISTDPTSHQQALTFLIGFMFKVEALAHR